MKKVLVFLYYCDYMAIEEAVDRAMKGDELYVVGCDHSVGICSLNYKGNRTFCRFCRYTMEKHIKKTLAQNGKRCNYVTMADLITKEDKKNSHKMAFSYNSVQELKSLKYRGVEIGYGAFSTFASHSLNIRPTFNQYFHEFIDCMLRSEVVMIDALNRYVDTIMPDIIVFHNGRFSNLKPLLGIALNRRLDFISTESWSTIEGVSKKNSFYNDTPHSMVALYEKMQKAWENCGPNAREIGKSFYENKVKNLYAGDVVYTANQKENLLPTEFDRDKHNIAIFTSSEDEYFAISEEYDNAAFYPNQYEGLKDIFDHFKERSDIHFYVRIHPRQAKVPYRSHMELYTLIYDNVTIIPPTSPISSYALMMACKKVIVFNSTIGMESAYWEKPVIALYLCYFTKMGVSYQPKTPQEVYKYIDDKELPALRNEEVLLKAGCFMLGQGMEDYRYIHPVKKPFKFLGHILVDICVFKIFNSSKLYTVIERILMNLDFLEPRSSRFRRISDLSA